jgi:hypothetical protein
MEQECVRLDAARNAIKAKGFTGDARRAVPRRPRHQGPGRDLRLSAGRAGRRQPVPADRAHAGHRAAADALVDQHVDAIRAIITRNTRGDSERMRRSACRKAAQVTDEFLAHENRDRPDYLESILSPPLAPGG